MQQSYTANYIKTYFWQGIAITLNLLAMFVVVPKLSESPAIYGIYSIVVSLTIFLNYADLGFFSAALKYAGESYARNDLNEEIEVTGFACFILLIFVMLFALAAVGAAMNPHLLIKNLDDVDKVRTATVLLIIFAAFSPVVVLQRLLQIVFGIRIEAYINQRIQIAANLAKILSVLYFFRSGSYDIIGYFAFFNFMNLAACIVSAIISRHRYDYDYLWLLRSLKFSKKCFRKTKDLSITSFYVAVTHVFYYEIDFFVIGRFLGPERVALYAIGMTLQSFIRSLFGVLFTPFSARFNHFIGLNDTERLTGLLHSVIVVTMPIVVFSILSMTLLMEPLVLCWVGADYTSSIPVAKFLVLCFLFSFISYPAGSLLIAQEKLKWLYITSSILPVVYWICVTALIGAFDITAFAMSKFIAITVVNGLFLWFIIKNLNMQFVAFMKTFLAPLIIPCVFMTALLFGVEPYLPAGKGRLNLLLVIAAGGCAAAVAVVIYAFGSERFRNHMRSILDLTFLNGKAAHRYGK